jgi:hypothetical protein
MYNVSPRITVSIVQNFKKTTDAVGIFIHGRKKEPFV